MPDKRRLITALQTRFLNPLVRRAIERGWAPPGYAILETVGRRTGQVRRTPVGDGRRGNTFWIVAEHGRRAGYVRNIETNPRVRVLTGRRWRTGTAQVLPDDDPRERQRHLGRLNAVGVRAMGTELLTVRIDLDLEDGRTG
jgi:deazaflavin-dependent oxidoreductase (nitroreductase family)